MALCDSKILGYQQVAFVHHVYLAVPGLPAKILCATLSLVCNTPLSYIAPPILSARSLVYPFPCPSTPLWHDLQYRIILVDVNQACRYTHPWP